MSIELLNVDDDMSHVVSHYQLSFNCGWQLMFHRAHVERGPKSVVPIYGSAVHHGIETGAGSGDTRLAVDSALHAFRVGFSEADETRGVVWTDPPRLRRDGHIYKGDEARIPNEEVAEQGIRMQVGAWMQQYGHLEIDAAETEREVRLELQDGWELICKLDMPTVEGGLLDVKTARAPWEPRSLTWKRLQAQLYMPAFKAQYGEVPAYFAFHVLPRGTSQVQVVEVPYDAEQIEIVYERLLPALIRQIENQAFLPNVSGWWHSPDGCDWWYACPLGGGGSS